MTQAADPPVVGQDQLDDVGLSAGFRARDEDVAGRVWCSRMLACQSGHSGLIPGRRRADAKQFVT
jgi:hypothetical protein